MNIFVLFLVAEEAARSLCDKHVVKMIVETAQLLSTAYLLLGPEKTDAQGNQLFSEFFTIKSIRMDFAQRITEKYMVTVRVFRSKRKPMLAYTVQATLRNWEGVTVKDLDKLKRYIPKSGFVDGCGTNFFFFVCIRGCQYVDDIWLDHNSLESVVDHLVEILEN